MAVQEHRLDARQEGIRSIQVSPARLNHADFLIREVVDGFRKHVRRGNKICIENENVLPLAAFHSVLQGSSLKPRSINAVDQLDIETRSLQFGNILRRDLGRFVRGIVQNLRREGPLCVIASQIQTGSGLCMVENFSCHVDNVSRQLFSS